MTIEPRKRAFPSASRPFATRPARSPRTDSTALLRALRLDVREHDRHLEPTQEERRELGGHQARADHADRLHPTRLRLGNRRRSLDAPFHDVERVDRGLRLRAREQLGEGILLGRVTLGEAPRGRALDQLERTIRRRRLAVDDVVDTCASLADDLRDVRQVRRGHALALAGLDPPQKELERLVEELDRLEDVVDETELERVAGAEQAVLPEGVVDDQPNGCLGADEARRQLGAAPRGEQAEEDLGEAEVANARRERADVAVEGDLEPAAERRAVHRGERRERQLRESSEELVTGPAALAGALGRDPGELRHVGARGEDQRLPREHEPAPAARLETIEDLREGRERVGAEGGRRAPVGAVVDRDEGDGADAGGELLQVEAGHRRVSHDACSPTGGRRPSPARCRAQ